MELKIKLEAYNEGMVCAPLSEAECRISIDPKTINSEEGTILQDILCHLYQVLTNRMKTINTQAE